MMKKIKCDIYQLKIGEYYIDELHIKKYKTYNNEPIHIESGFYSCELILYLLKMKFITIQNIKYQILAERSLEATFIQKLY